MLHCLGLKPQVWTSSLVPLMPQVHWQGTRSLKRKHRVTRHTQAPEAAPEDAPEAELDSQGKGQAAEAAAALASSLSLGQSGYGG